MPTMDKIKYIKSIKEVDGMKVPVYGFHDVETDFIKQYKNCISSIFKLTKLATKYILFVTEMMDKDNVYNHVVYNKKKFIEHLNESGEEICNIGSLDKVAVELVQKGFFIALERGTYLVNPELFWKDDEKNRINKIKFTLEFERNKDMNLEIEKK